MINLDYFLLVFEGKNIISCYPNVKEYFYITTFINKLIIFNLSLI